MTLLTRISCLWWAKEYQPSRWVRLKSHNRQFKIPHKDVCVCEATCIPHYARLCVWHPVLNYTGCSMRMLVGNVDYEMQVEYQSPGWDRFTFSIWGNPIYSAFVGKMIVSIHSPRIINWNSTQGCEFHTHYLHSPRVVNWNSTQGCVYQTHHFIFLISNSCSMYGNLLAFSKLSQGNADRTYSIFRED